ncbi:MAG: peptidase M22 [Clostridia bacterium]|nr:peptidase M22 [Clostridia bacterium]
MPNHFLGIDTSNYTTSAALVAYDGSEIRVLSDARRLLPVRPGERGIRQNEAVFHHTAAIGAVVREACAGVSEKNVRPEAVGVSTAPTGQEGSYMPCFSVGRAVAESLGAVTGAAVADFSHQQGHVAAVAFGAGRLDILRDEFIAFHVSGGTTEAVLVRPDRERVIACEKLSGSLDLKAGQLIDRAGLMLGLSFPAGKELDALARRGRSPVRPRVFIKDGWVSVSGAQNVFEKMLSDGESRENAARYCVDYICEAVRLMTTCALEKHPGLPVLYSGGVMSNSVISETLDGVFCPAYATDNAVGTAVLAALLAAGNDSPGTGPTP